MPTLTYWLPPRTQARMKLALHSRPDARSLARRKHGTEVKTEMGARGLVYTEVMTEVVRLPRISKPLPGVGLASPHQTPDQLEH
ncbi:hypothetical protein TgHK011_001366 [Trichoderma gracile]|nr:hypothetical protein TgHK011_001366 [Trichoderma gracile]